MTRDDITEYKWLLYPLDDKAPKDGNFLPMLILETPLKPSDVDTFLPSMQFDTWDSSLPAYVGSNEWNVGLYISTDEHFKIYSDSERIYIEVTTKSGEDILYLSKGLPNTRQAISSICLIVVHTSDDYYMAGLRDLAWTGLTNYIVGYPTSTQMGFCSPVPEIGTDFVKMVSGNNVDTTIREMIGASKRPPDKDDPYDGGDKPDDDNTSGDYDYNSDKIPEPDLPSTSVTDSGFVTLYAPTEGQLKALSSYLWSDAFSIDTFKKMINNPMDCILGLTIVPVNLPSGPAKEITVGNIVTTVSCNTCPTQYVKVDCGTFTFDRHNFTNSYLDYSPYTKCYLYLPFIGTVEINIDEFMQSTMHITYHVDVLTGAMFCYVMRNGNVVYNYMGQCSENVPLSSSSYANTIGSIMTAASSIVGVASVAATGGASAPIAAGLLAGATTSTANAVTSLKPSVSHSGSLGGGAGIMGVNYPYLIFIAPHTAIPSEQRFYTGYPSNQIVKLSSLKGYQVIQAINLAVPGANDSEMAEIENLLKEGVIL